MKINNILSPKAHLELVRTRGSKFGRALMGLLFLVAGLSMLMNPAASVSYFTSLGIPMAGVLVYVIAVKVIAGGAIVIGKRTTEAAAALIIFTLIATLLGHLSPSVDPSFPIGMLKNLAIVGGLLYLMSFGPNGMNVKGKE